MKTEIPPLKDNLDRPRPQAGDGSFVIEARDVVKRFGKTSALDGLNMRVPRGSVYALLGRNGAGKSTLIQLLMGMLEPTSGEISVVGLDPVSDDVALKNRVGYIPERLPMYDWMTVDQVLRFVAGIYAHWSPGEEQALVERFGLTRDRKVGALSRGNRALLSLIIAMAHQPEVVLLDECTSGMDAVARLEFDRSVIDALHDSGRTILFASHQLEELERICDWVGIIHEGRMIVESPAEALKARVRTLRIIGGDEPSFPLRGPLPPDAGGDPTFPLRGPLPPDAGGDLRAGGAIRVLSSRRMGREWVVVVDGPADLYRSGTPLGDGQMVEDVIPMTLEEIFVALVGGGQ